MYKQILVPLDGSVFAEDALPLALETSRRTGADIHLATVLEPVTSFAYEGWEGAAVEWSEKYLEDVLGRLDGQGGGDLTHAVLSGHTVEMLQSEAEAESADLVVMASHGRGALSRMWLGSVADGFVRHTSLPVVVVRPEEKAEPAGSFDHSFETLLIPLDGSELSERALEHATEFGELFDSAYHLTRIVSYPVDIASPYLPHTAQVNQQVVEDAKEGAAQYLEAHAEAMRRRGLRGRGGGCGDDRHGDARTDRVQPGDPRERGRQGAARQSRTGAPLPGVRRQVANIDQPTWEAACSR
jgi:nucleotide-binding universal stress UspA family protein